MEKIKSICVMSELFKSLAALEAQLEQHHGVSLNQAMVLCCIGGDTLTASAIAEGIGLTHSNTSKILRSAEEKGLIKRSLGEEDRRCMLFALTPEGEECLHSLKTREIDIPEFIRPLF